MAFSTQGFQPQHETYLQVGQKYKTRIARAEVRQSVDNGAIVDQLFISLDVSGVKSPVPNSIRFRSRPMEPGKSQDAWDRRWTRFKEVFGIDLMDENFNAWAGKIGTLEVSAFKGSPFFDFPKSYAGTAESAPAQVQQVIQQLQAPQSPAPLPSDNTFKEDIPF